MMFKNSRYLKEMDPEVLTVRLRFTEISPINSEKTSFGMQKKITCKTIEELAGALRELKDPKNSPTITNMISTIFKDHAEKMIFAKHEAKISVEVLSSSNLPVLSYTKSLIGGYEFDED